MAAALGEAHAAGVAPRDLAKYNKIFNKLQHEQTFQLQVLTMTQVVEFKVSSAKFVREVRRAVADQLGWQPHRTLLSVCGEHGGLLSDVQTMHECGISPARCV